MTWPILYKNVLKVKNPNSPVGVATMWTERGVVEKTLSGADYSVIGNLYSSAGISAMIRNMYANPAISKIVLWGADLSRSGQALLSFMEHGVDDHHFIIGDEKKGQIEQDIPKKDLDHFRKSVEIINLRGKPVTVLQDTVKKLSKEKIRAWAEAKTFPSSKPKPFTFPSEQMGFRVYGDTVALTWLRLLNVIFRYGRNKETRYTQENELKEVLNLMAVIYNENIDEPYLPHFFPFSKKDIDTYIPQVVSAKKIPGVSYTYGQRLREWFEVDQVQEVIDLIKRRPFSKKMAMFTSDVRHDWGRENVDRGDTPCLTQIFCSIQDNKLFMTAHFRSHDMTHGWPRNAFSLLKLQDIITKETNYERGPLCMISHSAHIYSDDYELVGKILKDNLDRELPFKPNQHFEIDRRGNIVVEVVGQEKRRGRPGKSPFKKGIGKISVKLYSPDGGLLLKEWQDMRAKTLVWKMTDHEYFSLPAHMLYVGTELQRAQQAIQEGNVYSQDPVG